MGTVSLSRVDIWSPALPRALDGLRILQVTDLHADFRLRRRGRRFLAGVAGLDVDVVVCTGDTVNHERWWPLAVEWLSRLPAAAARLAVPGNWEYRVDGGEDVFASAMRRAGFVPLCNRPHCVQTQGGVLQVAGFDDIRYGAFDPDRALEGLDPGGFILGLSHNPDLLLHLEADRVDVLLSGHTHGGQVCLPRLGALTTSTQMGTSYAAGLFGVGEGRFLYVSRGLGEGRYPWRLGCPRETNLLTLRTLPAPSDGVD